MRRAILVCLLAASLLSPPPAHAERTRFWRQSDYADFEKGTADGVAIRSDGKLIPAPRFAQFSDPNLAYLWALRVDSQGRLYAAGGSNAKVVRMDESGKATTVFESAELAAQAIALDAQDNLYVGTSPDGKVYKVAPQGQRSVLFEPKTKYIWALVIDAQGNLFVGTGDKGEVFVVSKEGQGELFYKSEERHARSLAFDSKGNLLIGTEPNGLIVRVDVQRNPHTSPKAGAAFVIYETDRKEVTSLLTGPSGDIFVASVGEKPRTTSTPTPPMVVEGGAGVGAVSLAVAATGQHPPVAQQPQIQQPMVMPPFPALSGGSEVYRIAPNGSPETLWESRDDLVYSLGFSPAGKLLLGTGNHGTVIELDGDNIFTSLAKTASTQVTSLATGPRGTVYLATANPGKVFTLGPDYAEKGSFESQTFDAKIFSQWGRLTWWGERGPGKARIEFYVRSGNTSNPEKNWSAWAGPYSDPAGETAACPPARFAQWKAVFLRPSAGDAPAVSWVSLAYQPKNVAPAIDSIVVQNPGVRAQGISIPSPIPGGAQPVPLRMPQSLASPPNIPLNLPDLHQKGRPEIPPQGMAQRGYQTVLWSARDDNDDDLIFTLYYRGEGEKEWKLLKDKIDQHFYSWDTTTMPDGAYYLKLVASDAPSNPPDEALSTERESDRFEVDNTPPTIGDLRAETSDAQASVRFAARDSSSAIARAEYSLDAGDWELVFPVGRLTDSRSEDYRLALKDLAPGEHTLAVRVSDRFDNSTTAKVTFTIARQKSR
jgi:WD40 repeat protein